MTNWREYNEALVRSGDVTLWFSDEVVEAWEPLTKEDLTHRYLWGPAVDQLLADEAVVWEDTDQNGTDDSAANHEVLWTLTDHLGTVRDLVDSAGALQNHKSYDAFGNVTAETNAAKDAVFGFTGKFFDETTKIQNNLNRCYDAKVGGWVSEDPIGFAGGDANFYRYVGNRITSTIDPNGLQGTMWSPMGVGGPIMYGPILTQDPGREKKGRLNELKCKLQKMLDDGAFDGSPVKDDVEYAIQNSSSSSVSVWNGSSMNNPLWPGITLDQEAFYGPDATACAVLVHEWMHNLDREGLGHDYDYFDGESINGQVGPYSDNNSFQESWDRYHGRNGRR